MDNKEKELYSLIVSLDVRNGEMGARTMATMETFGTDEEMVMVGHLHKPLGPDYEVPPNVILELRPHQIPGFIKVLQRYHRMHSSAAARIDLIR